MTNIADYIVGFYKSVRLHSKLGNLPPNAFEQKSAIKLPIAVSEKLDQHSNSRMRYLVNSQPEANIHHGFIFDIWGRLQIRRRRFNGC
ncbi:hypothetical protein [Comamonas sp.]|uniref:hypothetical protein n=1 Tax=Comamonas sp. TaxID=34028 RepID=UPI003917DC40